MKYNTVTLGQIEAMINKLGGESGMQDFLAGRMEVVKRKFHQFGDDLLNGKGTFTVPDNYNHDTQVDDFAKKTRKLKSTYYYNDELTSKNFSKATNKLVPGKTYGIKMFPILETVESEDCLAFLESNNAILVGAQGVTALQADQPDIFPTRKWTVSFDEKDALWKDAGGDHRVPYVHRPSDGVCSFDLGYFGRSWYSDYVLVCFCDLD
ncbi:hypothetical protein H6776_02485 [Candidatus Nomurabacteria bacterium]|nr:hypothetical protein [Candidatus Nomurabacteria bacterium]